MALTLTDKYRSVFNTPDGQEVLQDILDSCNYFSLEEPGVDTLILHNFAKSLLAKCGILTIKNKGYFLQALFKIPVDDPERLIDKEKE